MNHRLKKKKGKVLPEECWNLDYTLAKYILPRLQYFREHVHTYPGFITMDEWKDILDQMITAFQLIVNIDKVWYEENECEAIANGLKLFAEYYLHLWD